MAVRPEQLSWSLLVDADRVRSAPADAAEARFGQARRLLPLVYRVRDDAKRQSDAIGAIERRFGTAEIRHLARLLDDLWMAADSLICDIQPRDAPRRS